MEAKLFVFIAWILSTLGVISLGTSMITISDTLANIAGVFIITFWGILSFKTKCFVGIINFIHKFKKNKKNEE